MRMRGAPGIRPGSGKGQAVRCRRAVPVTSTVLGGMGLTASVPVPESGTADAGGPPRTRARFLQGTIMIGKDGQ